MNKTRVCHITTVHPVFDTRIFYKECISLAEIYDVTLIGRSEHAQTVEGIHIVSIGSVRASGPGRIVNFFRALSRAVRVRARIYHFHDPELLPLGLIIKLLTRRCVVYDMHEDVKAHALSKTWYPVVARTVLAYGLRMLEKLILPFLDGVIVAAPSLVPIYERSVIVRNYPIVSESPTVRRTGRDRKGTVLIYLGAISEKRNPFVYLEALRILGNKHRDVRLSLVGPVYPAEFAAELDRRIRNLGLDGRVEVTGQVRFDEGQRRVSESDIGLCVIQSDPNYIDALPTKMFEYMVHGKPVVVSDFSLWKSIVESAECGFAVDPSSPEEVAEALDTLLRSRERMKKMGENGKKAVLNRYRWKKESQILKALYRQLIRCDVR